MLLSVLRRFRSELMFGLTLAGPAVTAEATYAAVDLTPAGFTYSSVNAVAGALQAGTASTGTLQPEVSHAGVWAGSAAGFTDVHPPLGFANSFIVATDGTRHVGSGSGPGGGAPIHALLWNGSTPGSAVDLHPAGATFSRAAGVGGAQQAGVVGFGGPGRAALWSGTAASFVNLHPSGVDSSETYDTDGARQVGQTWATATARARAAMWSGTAASFVSLHPTSGYSETAAVSIDGGTQAGWGLVSGNRHALMWNGTADSVFDLHPSGYLSSMIHGSSDGRQFGSAVRLVTAVDRPQYAMVWDDTAGSAVNLGELLPAGYTNSYAIGMDAFGNIYGAAWVLPPGSSTGGGYRAIMWAVPEPAAAALLVIPGLLAVRCRRGPARVCRRPLNVAQSWKPRVTAAPRSERCC